MRHGGYFLVGSGGSGVGWLVGWLVSGGGGENSIPGSRDSSKCLSSYFLLRKKFLEIARCSYIFLEVH